MSGECPSEETIAQYVEGTLTAEEREALEAHLSVCEACRAAAFSAGALEEAGESPAAAPESAVRRALAEIRSRGLGARAAVGRGPRRPGRAAPARRGRRRRSRPRAPRSAFLRYAVIPLSAAATLLICLRYIAREPRREFCAEVVELAGRAELIRAGRKVRARPGDVLDPGQRIETGPGSLLRLSCPSGTRVCVNSSTALSLATSGGAPGISMDHGEIYVETAPADEGFYVETPHGRAVDLGTRFGVESELRGTTVAVVQGKVEVSTRAGAREVRARQEVLLAGWTSPPGPVREAPDLEHRLAWVRGGALVGLRPPLPAAAPQSQQGAGVEGLLVLYRFDEGRGAVVHDVSGAGAPLDLHVQDAAAVRWLEGGGLEVHSPTLVVSAGPAAKIVEACRKGNEITIEAWIRPADSRRGNGRIVTLSDNVWDRNFTLQQGVTLFPADETLPDVYAVRMRTTATDLCGMPSLYTGPGTVIQRLTHLAYTRGATGRVRLFVNGRQVPATKERRPRDTYPAEKRSECPPDPRRSGAEFGDFSNWGQGYRLGLANEMVPERPWLGEYHLVAVYGRALPPEEVKRLFEQGLGR